jgi:hypothetical protein
MSFTIFAKAVSTVEGFLCAVHADDRARAKKPTFIPNFKFRIDFTSVLFLEFGDPRLDFSTHIGSTPFAVLYRRCPMNISEDDANLAPGIKSPAWKSYLRQSELEVKLAVAGRFARRWCCGRSRDYHRKK